MRYLIPEHYPINQSYIAFGISNSFSKIEFAVKYCLFIIECFAFTAVN